MIRRLVVLTTSVWSVGVTGFIGATANQDLTDKPAVQDAVLNFGHPSPFPERLDVWFRECQVAEHTHDNS